MDVIAPLSRSVVSHIWSIYEGSAYLRHYRGMLRTQFDPPETVQSRQEEMLNALIEHAYRTSPFWRDRFRNANLSPAKVCTLDLLRRLPILTKADLRAYGDDMRSCDYAASEVHKHVTSGSTGVSVVTYRDDACQQFKRAATLRSDEWSGWRRGERIASVWGNPQVPASWKGRLRRALLDRRYLFLDTLKMDERAIDVFVDGMVRRPPSMLFGHAHSLYLVAVFLKARRPTVVIRPKGIVSTCMVLHDFERRQIEETFSCKVTDRYGCEEVSLIACQCERHEGLHVNSDCLYVEIIDADGRDCPPSKPGRVVVTDLVNRAMPLFRYEVGDTATWAESPCPCGRTLRTLKRIEGRVADYVVTSAGEYISGISLTENFAVQLPGVAQIQIIQEEVDRFTFNIVRASDFGENSLAKLRELVTLRFGAGARYDINFLDQIPVEPSGKYRFCISKVAKAFV